MRKKATGQVQTTTTTKVDFIENDGLTTAQRLAVYQRDGGRCQLCGNSVAFGDMIAGFINPSRTVDATDLAQRITLHFKCHIQQGQNTIDEIRKIRRKKIHEALRQKLSDIPLGMGEILKEWEDDD